MRESDGRVKAAENLVNHYIELEAQWNTTLQKMDCLRAMERCSSSGVLKSLEGNLKLVDDEQPALGPTFDGIEVCKKLGSLTTGSWTVVS